MDYRANNPRLTLRDASVQGQFGGLWQSVARHVGLLGDLAVEAVEAVQQGLKGLLELSAGVVFGQLSFEPLNVRELVDTHLLVGVRDVGLPLVQGLLARRGLGAQQAGFEQEMPEQKAREDAAGHCGAVVAEAPGDEHREEVLDDAQTT